MASAETDLKDLEEINDRLKKYQDKRDITELEMVFKILEDWIDELKKVTGS